MFCYSSLPRPITKSKELLTHKVSQASFSPDFAEFPRKYGEPLITSKLKADRSCDGFLLHRKMLVSKLVRETEALERSDLIAGGRSPLAAGLFLILEPSLAPR